MNQSVKIKKRFLTATVLCCLFFQVQAIASNSNSIAGVWNVTKIETTDPNINSLIAAKFKETVVEFTKAGTVKISGKETNTRYSVGKSTIKFSSGLAEKMNNPEISAEIKKNDLKLNLPAEVTKQLILTVKDEYLKSGGEALVAKMIENLAKNSKIDACVELKRK